jgi:hypothetical protein
MAQAVTINPLSAVNWHANGDLKAILSELGTSKESGLSSAEATKRLQM